MSSLCEGIGILGATHKNWNDHKKSTCLHELIYRIQCLLPETWGICKDSYTIHKDDPQFLSCSVCKQEVHRECYMPLLKKCDKNLAEAISKINGLHYLCPSCEYDLIPNDEIGLKKKKSVVIDENPKAPFDLSVDEFSDSKAKGEESLESTKDRSETPPDKIESISNTQKKKSSPLHPNIVVENKSSRFENKSFIVN